MLGVSNQAWRRTTWPTMSFLNQYYLISCVYCTWYLQVYVPRELAVSAMYVRSITIPDMKHEIFRALQNRKRKREEEKEKVSEWDTEVERERERDGEGDWQGEKNNRGRDRDMEWEWWLGFKGTIMKKVRMKGGNGRSEDTLQMIACVGDAWTPTHDLAWHMRTEK